MKTSKVLVVMALLIAILPVLGLPDNLSFNESADYCITTANTSDVPSHTNVTEQCHDNSSNTNGGGTIVLQGNGDHDYPVTPYMCSGLIFYENGTVCNNPAVNITNMNNSKQWQAKTSAGHNYYRFVLANGTDVNASEILRFEVRTRDGHQSKVFSHTVNETELNNGGVFQFNITLGVQEIPVTPFVIYGCVSYENGNPCNDSSVNITNTNTSTQWQAETISGYSYYQLILDTANVSADDVLEFNVSDGMQFNTSTRIITHEDLTDGGIFDFNLTLSTLAACPVVESIMITPDDDEFTTGTQINPNAGCNKTVFITVVISDPNGWDDINITEAVVTGPATVADSPVTLALIAHDSTTATFNGTFNMSFYYHNGTYIVNVTATDNNGLTGSNATTFVYQTVIALALDAATIAFGSADPDENRSIPGDESYEPGSTNGMTIKNTGNVEIDLDQIDASDLVGSAGTLSNANLYCGFTAGDHSINLDIPTSYDLNLSADETSYNRVNFRLHVPTGTAVGSYSGNITMTAASS